MIQQCMKPENYEKEVEVLLYQLKVRHILLVCGKSAYQLPIYRFVEKLQQDKMVNVTHFGDFSPNPKYEDILQGVKTFSENKCDFILAIGGGSAIDVAKCIKLFLGLKSREEYFRQEMMEREIPFFAVPTTGGSGSEATSFAVLYIKGEKHSIEHKSLLPNYVLLDPDNLITLSEYQKKVTICDALSHAIESYWSLQSTMESRKLSEAAIHLILDNMDGYFENDISSCKQVLFAANYAGRAIHITKTTAAHAMSYKLITLFDISHGHAVMLCLPEVWEYTQRKYNTSTDRRGQEHLQEMLVLLAHCLGQETSEDAIQFLKQLRSKLGLELTRTVNKKEFALLVDSVNVERLRNHPITLTKDDLYELYQNVLRGK